MSRIKLEDSVMDVIVKMSDGNPGAMTALMGIMQDENKTDPDSFMGAMGSILLLDTFEIYGTDIYVLFSDICKKSIVNTLAVIRACQLGLFSSEILKDASSRQDYSCAKMVPVEDLYNKVCEQLPQFDSYNRVTQ